jgi:hypothetical protein
LSAGWRRGEHDAEERILVNVHDPDFARAAVLTGRYLSAENADLAATTKLVKRLRSLNVNYRRPAAHDEVVEAAIWSEGRARVLGEGGILTEIVEALP